MKQYNIKLNKVQLDSLKSFLERSNLSGREIQSFISIVQAVNDAEKIGNSPKIKRNIQKIKM